MNKNKNLIITVGASVIALIFILFLVTGLFSEPKSTESNQTSDEKITSIPEKDVIPPLENNIVTLSFIGDCIIGSDSGKVKSGNFSWYAENKPHDYFFSQVYKELSKDTLTFANV